MSDTPGSLSQFRPDPRALDGAYVAIPLDGRLLSESPTPPPRRTPRRAVVKMGLLLGFLGLLAMGAVAASGPEDLGGRWLAAGSGAAVLLWAVAVGLSDKRPVATAVAAGLTLSIILFALGGFSAAEEAGTWNNRYTRTASVGMPALGIAGGLIAGILAGCLQRVRRAASRPKPA